MKHRRFRMLACVPAAAGLSHRMKSVTAKNLGLPRRALEGEISKNLGNGPLS